MFQKKSLGQHFLTSAAYVRAIAEAGNVRTGDAVLEIGPGRGILTAELLSRGARVIAIEKDSRLIPELSADFAREIAEKNLHLTEGDALTMEPKSLGLTNGAYKVVANIPYYITGALFEKFLGGHPQPSAIIFLVQKEVAERIAHSKKESILSLSVKAFGTPRYVKTVPRGAFAPAPSVDSAILAIEHISRGNFRSAAHEKQFFALLHAGFAHKRKLLVRNLESVLGKNAPAMLKGADIPEKARAEDIPLEQWLQLAQKRA